MSQEEFKALCENMELNELGENLRAGLEVLCDKLYRDEGFSSYMVITGTLSSSYPDVIITEMPEGNPGVHCREIFRL